MVWRTRFAAQRGGQEGTFHEEMHGFRSAYVGLRNVGRRSRGGGGGISAFADEIRRHPSGRCSIGCCGKENPESLDAAIGGAMAALMRGDTDAADAHMERVQDAAGERKPEVLVRRALIAQQAKDFDKMRQYGEASGLAPGLLLAGEAALVDGERDDAKVLLERVMGGDAEQTAKAYLQLLVQR